MKLKLVFRRIASTLIGRMTESINERFSCTQIYLLFSAARVFVKRNKVLRILRT